jgi:hypothetical protein
MSNSSQEIALSETNTDLGDETSTDEPVRMRRNKRQAVDAPDRTNVGLDGLEEPEFQRKIV